MQINFSSVIAWLTILKRGIEQTKISSPNLITENTDINLSKIELCISLLTELRDYRGNINVT